MTCRALGDEETARLEFDAARRVFERLGAAPDRPCDGLSPAAASGDGTLTSRERQILALIVRGMTNRAIADALTISDRTVDRHVSNILTKLDLPSRSRPSMRLRTRPRAASYVEFASAALFDLGGFAEAGRSRPH